MNNSAERDNDGGDDDEPDGESIVGEWGGIDDMIDRGKYKIECVSVAYTFLLEKEWSDTQTPFVYPALLSVSLDRTFVRSFVLPSSLNQFTSEDERTAVIRREV